MNKKYVIFYQMENGSKVYVSKINMRCWEERELQLTDDKQLAKQFDKATAENIIVMNWWKHIGDAFMEKI
jgi:hypothetical protein